MDPCADDDAGLGEGGERSRNELAGGGEDDRGVELLGRPLVRSAGPLGAELSGERLAVRVAGAREGEDAASLVTCDRSRG